MSYGATPQNVYNIYEVILFLKLMNQEVIKFYTGEPHGF